MAAVMCLYFIARAAALPLLAGRRQLRELRSRAANVIPGCLGVDKDVHLDLHARIAIDRTERDAVHGTLVGSTQRAAAGLAETQAPVGSRGVIREIVLAAHPDKRTRLDLRISRARATEHFATAGTMTTAARPERCIDSIAHTAACTTTH